MRRANHSNTFNDGEVVIQQVNSKIPTVLEEQEITEEITVKVSPVKIQSRPRMLNVKGLGKCTRVAFSNNAGSDDSDESDEEKGNDADSSVFLLKEKKTKAALNMATRTRSTGAIQSTSSSSSTLQSAASSSSATRSGSIRETTPASTTTLDINTRSTAATKKFVMDSEMKNFNALEWKKGRQEKNNSTHASKEKSIIDDEIHLSHKVSNQPKKVNGKMSIDGSDEDSGEEQETCPLDISICETRELPKKSHKSTDILSSKNKVVSLQREAAINSKSNSDSSSRTRKRDHEEGGATPALNIGDNNIKRGKRVSFAGGGLEKGLDKGVIEQKAEKTKVKDDEKTITLTINGKTYTRLNILGKGGSSCVYRVMSQSDFQLYAYKRVEVKGSSEDNEAVFDSYVNEIELLRHLKGSSPYIIDLVDAEIDRQEMFIGMVMEAGEVDLAKVLSQKQRQAIITAAPSLGSNLMLPSVVAGLTPTPSSSSKNNVGPGGVHITGPTSDHSGELLNPFFARMVWQEMLEAVDHIHQNRIVHGDLKPANFVFVKGHLKLIDFGIAKAFSNDTTNIYRESQIGTVNYMAPEAIAPYSVDSSEGNQGENEHEGMSMRLGRASDIWSLGCILYQMLYGRPPFASLTTIQKLHAIPNPNYRIQFPENDGQEGCVDWDAIGTIKACLERDPRKRATIRGEGGLLSMPYLSVKARRSSEMIQNISEKPSSPKISKEKVSKCLEMIFSVQKELGAHKNQEKNKQLCEKMWLLLNDQVEEEEGDSEDDTIVIGHVSKTCAPPTPPTPPVFISMAKYPLPAAQNGDHLVAVINNDNRNVSTSVTDTPGTPVAQCLRSKPLLTSDKENHLNILEIDSCDKENNPMSNIPSKIVPLMASQAARLALVNAAAEAAKSRAATRAARATTSLSSVPEEGQEQGQGQPSSSYNRGQKLPPKQPLRVLPTGLQEQILAGQRALENSSSSQQRDKWIRPKKSSPEKQDIKSVIENRMDAMRKFLDDTQDPTSTGTFDFTDDELSLAVVLAADNLGDLIAFSIGILSDLLR